VLLSSKEERHTGKKKIRSWRLYNFAYFVAMNYYVMYGVIK